MSDRLVCGNALPPADGTRDREIIDRFADFLRIAGRPATRADIGAGRTRPRSPAERWRLRFASWWVGQVPPDRRRREDGRVT